MNDKYGDEDFGVVRTAMRRMLWSMSMEYDDRRMPVEMDDRGAVDGAAVLPVDVMQEFVTGLLRLRPELRDVVALRYSGMTYRSIAERQGVTVAAVEKRHRQAMAEWPELKALFPRKIAKQQTRRPHRRAKARVPGGS